MFEMKIKYEILNLMCHVVVINVRDGYNFPFSENIPS